VKQISQVGYKGCLRLLVGSSGALVNGCCLNIDLSSRQVCFGLCRKKSYCTNTMTCRVRPSNQGRFISQVRSFCWLLPKTFLRLPPTFFLHVISTFIKSLCTAHISAPLRSLRILSASPKQMQPARICTRRILNLSNKTSTSIVLSLKIQDRLKIKKFVKHKDVSDCLGEDHRDLLNLPNTSPQLGSSTNEQIDYPIQPCSCTMTSIHHERIWLD
jgi:hypothetical protein